MSKRAFTLIELLIVVVIITVLTTVVFRLANVGSDNRRKSITIARLQKIENCLSGYYAAFGTYPPVAAHGSTDIYHKYKKAGGNGDSFCIQTPGDSDNDFVDASRLQWEDSDAGKEDYAWKYIEPACRAQPVAARFPYANNSEKKMAISTICRAAKSRSPLLNDVGEVGIGTDAPSGYFKMDTTDWRTTQIFQFGLMSFLLPRYLFMMNYKGGSNGDNKFDIQACAQWRNNNTLPPKMAANGEQYSDWNQVMNAFGAAGSNGGNSNERWQIELIPSQAACARWMPNLEGVCTCNVDLGANNATFFGVNVRSGYNILDVDHIANFGVFTDNENENAGSGMVYLLDIVTVLDGWDRELYYYSKPPYQTYTLWSAGANGKTFPPWVEIGEILNGPNGQKAYDAIVKWTEDDIQGVTEKQN